MKRIRVSTDGLCAQATFCFPSWAGKDLRKKWLVDRILLRGVLNEGEIILTPVQIATDPNNRKLMMDSVTGSLYRDDGSCFTSDKLKLIAIRAENDLDKVLLSMKAIKALGGSNGN
jgi:hypothetical protein